MKKLIVVIIIAAMVAVSAVAMAACTDKEEVVSVQKIEATVVENTVIYVGETFDSAKFVITATLSDNTKVKITNISGVFYNKEGLKLVNNKYSESGELTLKITYLDKHEAEVVVTVNKVL